MLSTTAICQERIAFMNADMDGDSTFHSSCRDPSVNVKSSIRIVDFSDPSETQGSEKRCTDREDGQKAATVERFVEYYEKHRQYVMDGAKFLSFFPIAYPDLCLVALDGDRIVGMLDLVFGIFEINNNTSLELRNIENCSSFSDSFMGLDRFQSFYTRRIHRNLSF